MASETSCANVQSTVDQPSSESPLKTPDGNEISNDNVNDYLHLSNFGKLHEGKSESSLSSLTKTMNEKSFPLT